MNYKQCLNLFRVIAGLVILLGGGCGSGENAGKGVLENDLQNAGAKARTVLPTLEKGLEYRRYVVVGDRQAMALRALRAYVLAADADEAGITPAGFPGMARREVLRANGFRLIPVPMTAVEQLVRSFGAERIHDSTWLGQATDWLAVARGPSIHGTRIFSIGNDTLSYNEGQFRLLLRAYVVPFPERTIIRLEFLPQWYFELRKYFSLEPSAGPLSGELFGELGWALNLDGTTAAVLICEDPLVDWTAAEEAVKDSGADDANDEGEEAKINGLPAVGPEPIPIRTLGEEVLQSADGRRRLVIIFLPYLGDSANAD